MSKISLGLVPGKRGQILLINNATGEQLGKLEKNEIWEKRKIKHIDVVSSDQMEYEAKQDSKHFGPVKTFKPYSNFVKENMNAVAYLREHGDMSKVDWTIYNILKENASCISNYVKRSRSKYMTLEDVITITGIGKSTVYKAMKHLNELDVYKQDGKKMVLNPFIAYKGTEVSAHTEDLFKNTKYKEY